MVAFYIEHIIKFILTDIRMEHNYHNYDSTTIMRTNNK